MAAAAAAAATFRSSGWLSRGLRKDRGGRGLRGMVDGAAMVGEHREGRVGCYRGSTYISVCDVGVGVGVGAVDGGVAFLVMVGDVGGVCVGGGVVAVGDVVGVVVGGGVAAVAADVGCLFWLRACLFVCLLVYSHACLLAHTSLASLLASL